MLTTVADANETMFERILRLYAPDAKVVVDPTYGEGVFWKNLNGYGETRLFTDLSREGVDMTAMPYAANSADVVVLDPPYRYTPAANQAMPGLDERYNLKGSAPTRVQGVIALYMAGMVDAVRVLRRGGWLVVKCQDTIQDGRQHWVHIDLMAHAEKIGCPCVDLAVITNNPPPTRWEKQRSLRKAHSYFLVCRKGGRWPFGYESIQER